MLTGSVAGGVIAQVTDLGVPYVIRSVCLGLTLAAAFFLMKDLGFTPDRSTGPLEEARRVMRASLDYGWRKPPVRWLMLAALCAGGVDIFAFYALQPYLLELYGDRQAFGIAGLAAAIVAGSEMVAGVVVPHVHRLFRRRTDALIAVYSIGIACLALIGVTESFGVAIVLLVIWGLTFSMGMPIRQAYLNAIIPSHQRATVLSFDNLMGSAGGVFAQPALGRAADVWGYPAAYVLSAVIQLAAVPFLVLARRAKAPSDPIDG
jgi:MFS family permease